MTDTKLTAAASSFLQPSGGANMGYLSASLNEMVNPTAENRSLLREACSTFAPEKKDQVDGYLARTAQGQKTGTSQKFGAGF